jgi:hypothetical protein
MNQRSPVPDNRIPNVVPLRAMLVTTLEPGTPDAWSATAFAAAIPRFKNTRWFCDRNPATSTRADLRHRAGAADEREFVWRITVCVIAIRTATGGAIMAPSVIGDPP